MAETEEIIFGRNAVLSFLKGSEQGDDGSLPSVKINKILIAGGARKEARLDQICLIARQLKIPVKSCERRRLDQLVGTDCRHQGVVALVASAEIWPLDTLIEKVERDRAARERIGRSMDGYMLALLDGIADPHNLGAIIRVAEAAAVGAVLIPQHRAAGLTATVAKVSAGALATLPVVRVTNLVQAIERLKQCGFWAVGLDACGESVYTEADLKRPLAIVVGSEGQGISRLLRRHCDFLVRIPMLGASQSLNASVAAGILFYEVVRQCAESKPPPDHRSGKPCN